LRRQVGATSIDLDTIESYVEYGIGEPRVIDYAAIMSAGHDAGYDAISLFVVTVTGTTSRGLCPDCGERWYLRVPETDQVFELASEVPIGEEVTVRARVEGWDTGHPILIPE